MMVIGCCILINLLLLFIEHEQVAFAVSGNVDGIKNNVIRKQYCHKYAHENTLQLP